MDKIITSFCALALVSPLARIWAASTDKPNIIFVLVDDFRFDALGYCGNTVVSTPSIDNLARQGCFFRNAFSSTPISSASRASILTGLYERTHRYSFQSGPLEERYLEKAYPLQLRKAGYTTALYGKLGVKCTHPKTLFDEIENYDRNTAIKENGYMYKKLGNDTVHLTRYTGQKGLDFINRQDGKKPFFLSLCFSAPHAHDSSKQQYFWDKDQDSYYNDVSVPKPIMSDDKYFERLPEFVKSGFSRERWTWRFDTPEKYQFMMKGYYRMITGIDQELAKIRALLKAKNLEKNTVIIFLGDNGYFLGERQLADKWLMYDLSVRIPLIIYDPRVNEHREIEEQVLNVDITPTITDFAHGTIPKEWQGKSLTGFVKNKKFDLKRDTVLLEHLWEMPSIPSSEGVRTKDWKYFRYVNDKRVEELYHLSADPDEAFDLSKNPKYRNVLTSLRNKTDELCHRFSADGWIAPNQLKANYARKSGAANSDKPVFSWQIPASSKSQTAFQILVSSSLKLAQLNVGDVWNSQYVKDSSTSAVYAGAKLKPNAKYYWRVRIWDYHNRTSEYSVIKSL